MPPDLAISRFLDIMLTANPKYAPNTWMKIAPPIIKWLILQDEFRKFCSRTYFRFIIFHTNINNAKDCIAYI